MALLQNEPPRPLRQIKLEGRFPGRHCRRHRVLGQSITRTQRHGSELSCHLENFSIRVIPALPSLLRPRLYSSHTTQIVALAISAPRASCPHAPQLPKFYTICLLRFLLCAPEERS